ncbi:MFS transporter [Georgenia alba]|uniref:MFS transporter n=1 Tax=Georgenia alba TaxID=2233858 RepID=A0ABW2Q3R3_9MICO
MNARDRDDGPVAVSAAVFSITIGVQGVAFPLLALDAGYSPTAVGVLVALAAVAQFLIRLAMGPMLRRISDKWFVVASGILMALTCVLMVLSTHLAVLVVAQVTHGLARAFFWTGIQTHVVREGRSSVRGFSIINGASVVGSLLGPAVAGWLSGETVVPALLVATAAGVVTALVAVLLRYFPPFPPREPGVGYRERLFAQPGFVAGGVATTSAGSWRGILTSYVPVVLSEAGHSSSAVGLLSAAANGAVVFGSWLSATLGRRSSKRALIGSTLAAGVTTGVLGAVAGNTVAALIMLVLSGAAAGLLQVLGSAVAVDGVAEVDKGDAVATLGNFRSAGMFAGPALMAGAVAVMPVAAAFAVAGGLFVALAPLGWGKRRG